MSFVENDMREKVFVIPGWKKEDQIGSSAISTVYKIKKGFDVCAEKIIHVPRSSEDYQMADDEAQGIFHTRAKRILEAFAEISRISSRNIVRYEDCQIFRADDGMQYQVVARMEFLSSLETLCNKKEFSEETVVRMGIDICYALDILHQHNIVHTNIKPSNIFKDSKGNYKIGDAVSAKIFDNTLGYSEKDLLFLAPEIYRNEHYDPNVSTYSLGLVMHWLLNDRKFPFCETEEPTDASISRRLSGEEISVPAKGRIELFNVIKKACAYNPSERYDTAAQMMTALQNVAKIMGMKNVGKGEENVELVVPIPESDFSDDKHEEIVQESGLERRERKKKKRKLWITLLVLGVISIGASAVFMFYPYIQQLIFQLKPQHSHANVAGVWSQDQASHWYVCSCGEIVSKEMHVFGEWEVIVDATETSNGSMLRTCQVCSFKESSVVPSQLHTHTYSDVWKKNETSHWHECTCGEKKDTDVHTWGEWTVIIGATDVKEGSKERECITCNYKEIAIIPVTSHTHSFSKNWISSETAHWTVCNCGEKNSVSNHNYGSWTTEKEPTCAENGIQRRVCSVCKYSDTQTIDKLNHTYSRSWENDLIYHWHECLCGAKSGISEHQYGKWVTIKSPTCAVEGTKKRSCSVCRHAETQAIDKLTHAYSQTWSSNADYHWHECSCGTKTQFATHSFGAWTIIKNATCNSSGTQKRVCSVCRSAQTKDIPMINHSFVDGYCKNCGVHDGNTYQLSFNANGGSVSLSSINLRHGDAYGSLPTPTRDYYTFDGWYTDVNGGTKVNSSTKMEPSNVTLYAHWTLNAAVWALESQVPSGAKIEDEKWVYTRTQFAESTATSIPGWTQTGSYWWNKVGQDTQNYSTQFHDGFDKNHHIYKEFAKSAPFSAYENDTKKRVVTDNWGGYVYWHWMYDVQYANTTERTISPYYGSWSAEGVYGNGFMYKYFYAFLSSTNAPYLSHDYCCSKNMASYYCANILPETSVKGVGTPRFFRFEYRVCTYTDYEKVFEYKKVTGEESYSKVTNGGEISDVQRYVLYRPK